MQLLCVLCCSRSNSHSTLSAQQHVSQPHVSQQQYESQDDAGLKRKRDRFKGMSEDEVLMRMLPDHLVPNLDIVVVSCYSISFLSFGNITTLYFDICNLRQPLWVIFYSLHLHLSYTDTEKYCAS